MARREDAIRLTISKPNENPLVLIEEKPQQVTIGDHINCTYTLKKSPFQKKHRLILKKGDQYFLKIPEMITGSLVSKGEKEELKFDSLKRFHILEEKSDGCLVPFHPGMRAILETNGQKIALEFLSPRSPVSIKPLPIEYRLNRLEPSDILFSIISVLLISSSIAVFLKIRQIELPPKAAENQVLNRKIAKLILEQPVRPPQELEKELIQETQDEKKSDPKTKKKKRVKKKRSKVKTKDLQSSGLLAYLSNPDQMVDSKALDNAFQGIGVLTSKGPKRKGSSGVSMPSRNTSNVDDMMAGLSAKSGGVSGRSLGKSSARVKSPYPIGGSQSALELRSFADIDRVIRRYLPGIQYLYERYLRKDPALRGRINIQFTIQSNGAVSNVKVLSSEMKYPPFESELAKRISLWQFPAIQVKAGSVSVEYPFTFLPKNSG